MAGRDETGRFVEDEHGLGWRAPEAEVWAERDVQLLMALSDSTWFDVHDVARVMGHQYASGSGIENGLDRLVDAGKAVVEKRPGAAMGKVYRRAT